MGRLLLFCGGPRVGWSWKTNPLPDDHDRSAFVIGAWFIWRSFSCWLVGLVIFFYLVRRIEGIGGTALHFWEADGGGGTWAL